MDYDVSDRTTKIYSDAAKKTIMFSFVYDDDGNRIQKKDHRTNALSYYSYDGSVTLAAIFEQQGTGAIRLAEQPAYGSCIILFTYIRQGGSYRYTLTDHVGSTRAVINRNRKSGGGIDLLYHADYYPFGRKVSSGGIDNKYGYQGIYVVVVGSAVSNIGIAGEVMDNFINYNDRKAFKGLGVIVLSEALDALLKKIRIKGVADEIFRQGAGLKLKLIEELPRETNKKEK